MASPVNVLMDTLPMTVGLISMNVQTQTSVTKECAWCVEQNNVTKLLLFVLLI